MQRFRSTAKGWLGTSAYGAFLDAAAAPLTGSSGPATTTKPKPTTPTNALASKIAGGCPTG